MCVGIPAAVTEEKLQSLLETVPGMGALKVSRSGLCHSYVWNIDWLQVGGDRAALLVNDSNVKVMELSPLVWFPSRLSSQSDCVLWILRV